VRRSASVLRRSAQENRCGALTETHFRIVRGRNERTVRVDQTVHFRGVVQQSVLPGQQRPYLRRQHDPQNVHRFRFLDQPVNSILRREKRAKRSTNVVDRARIFLNSRRNSSRTPVRRPAMSRPARRCASTSR